MTGLLAAAVSVSHGSMIGLGLIWWLECDPVSGLIAVCGLVLCLAAVGFADKLLGLWVHLAVFAHLVFGMRFDFYRSSGAYDELVHFMGMLALVAILVLRNADHAALRWMLESRWRQLILTSTLALALGAAWELFEFSLDAAFSLNAQQGLRDTNLDLLADLLGGAGAFIVVNVAQFYKSRAAHGAVLNASRKHFGEPHGN